MGSQMMEKEIGGRLKTNYFQGTYENVPSWVNASNATENVIRDASGNIVSSTAHAETQGKKFTGRVETDREKYLKSFINDKDKANYEKMKAAGYTGGAPGTAEYAKAKSDQVLGKKSWDGSYTAPTADKASSGEAVVETEPAADNIVKSETDVSENKTTTTNTNDPFAFLNEGDSEMGPPAPDDLPENPEKLGNIDEIISKEKVALNIPKAGNPASKGKGARSVSTDKSNYPSANLKLVDLTHVA